jgi:DNA-binding PadR family transcriptional regulator
VNNLMALAVLSTVTHRPMHPYEMATALRAWGKEQDMPIKWGSFYTVVRNLEKHGLLAAVESTREGRRPERTVYEITDAGRAELAGRAEELAQLEAEIHASVADLSALASQMEAGVRGSVRDIKKEMREAAKEARTPRLEEWRQFREAERRGPEAPPRQPTDPEPSELEARAADLLAEVRRLVRSGRVSPERQRVAVTVLESVRDQLRRLLS